jgi:hypothetical protein
MLDKEEKLESYSGTIHSTVTDFWVSRMFELDFVIKKWKILGDFKSTTEKVMSLADKRRQGRSV